MSRQNLRLKRKTRSKYKIRGTDSRPRLSVFRSNKHICGQLIDDENSKTLVQVSDMKFKNKGTKTDLAFIVGENIASEAKTKKITKIVFDRSGYKYHGRVRALAEGARKGGLLF
ncbi:50S ribosomal protein L18 [Candidatus Dojkabacteria bacterium]|nr:50S ribosomal protein L18 [Candidatus Dojkabacteria bacterium]